MSERFREIVRACMDNRRIRITPEIYTLQPPSCPRDSWQNTIMALSARSEHILFVFLPHAPARTASPSFHSHQQAASHALSRLEALTPGHPSFRFTKPRTSLGCAHVRQGRHTRSVRACRKSRRGRDGTHCRPMRDSARQTAQRGRTTAVAVRCLARRIRCDAALRGGLSRC